MLLRTDPFRDLDAFAQQAFAGRRAPAMPLDAYRSGDHFVVHLDVPGVDPDSIDLTVEKDVLTISVERSWEANEDVQVLASERQQGAVSRQLLLGKALDADRVDASYEHGVLTVKIPVAEQAKPRKVPVAVGGQSPAIEASTSSEAA